ncbi:MAG: hypothetical protein IKW90_14735 [Lachnospiraceae bacterium]|nr:hypothetical protein [Lachnospiraceae bacterium]
MENNGEVFYEAVTVVPGKTAPERFYFDSFEKADLWLSDFDNGEISEIIVPKDTRTEYEEIMQILAEMEEGYGQDQ